MSPEAIERVLDQRYMTGSVGGRAGSAKCSICGTDWAKESNGALPCRHKRGKVYEGKLAYFELGDITWREYSFVNIPADKYSQLKAVLDDGKSTNESEDTWTHALKVYSLDMDEESVLSLSENESPKNILESMKKNEAAFTYRNLKGTFLTASAYELLEKEEIIQLEKEIEEKFKFIQKDTTIESETVDDIDLIASKEKDAMTTREETVQEENDILAVAEGLRADTVSEDSEVSAQEESDEKTDEEELTEGSAEETDSESDSEVVDESKEDDSETAAKEEEASDSDENEDQQLVESGEEPEVVSDQDDLNENTEESSETQEESTDQSEELPSEAAQYEAKIQVLKEENAKLKQHLHFMLAERVVDTKIAVGYISADDRKEAVLEHEKRTASSLADALKDLQVLGNVKLTAPGQGSQELMDVKAHAVEGEDNTLTDEIVEEDETQSLSAEDKLIDRFAQVLNGRSKL